MTGRFFVFAIAVCSWLSACSPVSDDSNEGGTKRTGNKPCSESGWDDDDGDGLSDVLEGMGRVDTDGDGKPDSRDTDSDNDGRSDAAEGGVSGCDKEAVDSDFDGTPDFRDLDSDNNGIPDARETDDDTDGNGVPDWRDSDDDGDRISDIVEIGPDPASAADTDGDGVPDFHDLDSDGDGILDTFETDADFDADGLPSFRDDDSDGDGWSDADEYRVDSEGVAPVDTDQDGLPDFRDVDSDNDGLNDDEELRRGTSPTEIDSDGDGFTDLQELEAGTDPLDFNDLPQPDPCNPTECLPVELCGDLGSGDGLDNDCDGQVDEGCRCVSGEARPCFIGPPSARGQGVCAEGIEQCNEFEMWGSCLGGVWPEPEQCDGADNDCDGLVDEDLGDCASPLTCPSTQSAAPLSTFELEGSDIFDGDYESWSWEIFCPLTVDVCPLPENPAARDTSVYLVSSGSYRARATIVIGGKTYTCQYTIEVQGSGLRVELLWDTQGDGYGNTDVDLHLHRPETTTSWFHNNDDCYYSNCKASSWGAWGGDGPNWGLDRTLDVSACREAPHGHGAEWEELGYCPNPRLDVDVISCNRRVTDPTNGEFCAPENINVDVPLMGDIYRVGVDYFSAHGYAGVTHPKINIYCGGALRATLGEGEVEFTQDKQFWLVADVVFVEGPCGGIDCRITPILKEGKPWVQMGGDFGPAW